MAREPLGPGKPLETCIRVIDHVMRYTDTPYWLCFGGLWGLVKNNGVVPDADLDLCTYYGVDYKKIVRAFETSPGQYVMTRTMISDVDETKALYCSFASSEGLPHLCLSFWYPHAGVRYFCHDSLREIKGVMAPKSGFFFRGVLAEYVEDKPENFRMSEWPGLNQQIKIRVPRRHVGGILDTIYPDWSYQKQHYEVHRGTVQPERMVSYHKGGATSPFMVNVKGMGDFTNGELIAKQLEQSKAEYEKRLKAS